jgi:hypothetical protein
MAARNVKIRHDAETRAKIQVSQLVNRLTAHVLGEVDMVPSQVTAALGLLRKAMPDLAAVEHKGEMTVRNVARLPSPQHTADEWTRQNSPPLTH